MNELFHQVMRMNLDSFLESFSNYNIEEKRAFLAKIHLAYTKRKVFLECALNGVVYNGLNYEEEFKSYEYRYRLQFQTDICLQTSANYLYQNMIKLEEYYFKKLFRD